jgi:hypothetical protein
VYPALNKRTLDDREWTLRNYSEKTFKVLILPQAFIEHTDRQE